MTNVCRQRGLCVSWRRIPLRSKWHLGHSALRDCDEFAPLQVLTVVTAKEPRDSLWAELQMPRDCAASTNEVPSLWSRNRNQHGPSRGSCLLTAYPVQEMSQRLSDRGPRSDDRRAVHRQVRPTERHAITRLANNADYAHNLPRVVPSVPQFRLHPDAKTLGSMGPVLQ